MIGRQERILRVVRHHAPLGVREQRHVLPSRARRDGILWPFRRDVFAERAVLVSSDVRLPVVRAQGACLNDEIESCAQHETSNVARLDKSS